MRGRPFAMAARSHVTKTLTALLTLLMLGAFAAPAFAKKPANTLRRVESRELLKSVVERIDRTTAHQYGATDDQNAPLDGLKVVQVGGRNIGIYHAPGGGRFNVHVATSEDLITWTRRATLDQDASQATIAVTRGGGFVVAYERTTLGDRTARPVLPLDKLLPSLKVLDDPHNRIRVRLRYYRTVDQLLAGHHARQFTAPRQLSQTAEGTPSITRVMLRGGLISRSTIELGLHYFASPKGTPKVDRRATAVLTNFSRWQSRARPDLDAEFLAAKALHDGFASPPRGSIGDRDEIVLDGVRLEVHEAQYRPDQYATWRTFIRDPRVGVAQPLEIVTGGGSKAFGNPTVTELQSPDGKRAVFVTMYVFGEAAPEDEVGPLIYYREL